MDSTNSVIEYSRTDAALHDLTGRYAGIVFDVTTKAGFEQARKARAELRTYRVDLEKVRVEIKAPALERCRLIDAEAKRITAALLALEDPIDAQIKAEEARREEERTRAAREEAARIAEQERIAKEAEEKRLAAERAEIERQKAEIEREQREALESVHRHRGVGLTRQELFDRIGEEIYRQTGMLRPGKDLAAALATSDYRECRDAVWNAWVERKNEEIDAMIERALREREPE